jgi:aryl carrier-like protein
MKFKRNTGVIVRLAAEKSQDARRRVIAAITKMQRDGAAINFNTVCAAAGVSKTFLYDPKHADLAEQIRSLRQVTHQAASIKPAGSNKSDSAKDAQIVRFKERVRMLEERVQSLQQENELLYGKLSSIRVMGEPARASSASEVP